MKWIITKDLIDTNQVGYCNATKSEIMAFKIAHRITPDHAMNVFKSDMTDEFRLFDDDDVLYYEGLCRDLDNADQFTAFEPLDWATAEAGCSYMQTRKIGSTSEDDWTTL